MYMGNDLLLYESRQRAIERVRKMQEESQKRVSDEEMWENKSPVENKGGQNTENNIRRANDTNNNYSSNNSSLNNFQNRNNTSGFNQYNNFRNSQNSFNSSTGKGGIVSLLENFTKGNNGALNFLKGQLGEITGPLKGIMDYMDLDSEKLIIIMVMWMLFNEKADKTLLLALGYLLL